IESEVLRGNDHESGASLFACRRDGNGTLTIYTSIKLRNAALQQIMNVCFTPALLDGLQEHLSRSADRKFANFEHGNRLAHLTVSCWMIAPTIDKSKS